MLITCIEDVVAADKIPRGRLQQVEITTTKEVCSTRVYEQTSNKFLITFSHCNCRVVRVVLIIAYNKERMLVNIIVLSVVLILLMVLTAATSASDDVKRIQVTRGLTIPLLGIGTAALGNKGSEVVYTALSCGIRLIDTAQASEWYSEEQVGIGIKQYISSNGNNSGLLDDLVIVTKVHPRSYQHDKLKMKVKESKALLTVSNKPLDIVLLHAPYCWQGHCNHEESTYRWEDAWRSLEDIKTIGDDVTAIGVSNFDIYQLKHLLDISNTKVSVIQNWMDPLHQDKDVRMFAKENNIVYMAYSSFGTQWDQRKYHGNNPVLSNPILLTIAASYNFTVPDIVLAWLYADDIVSIPRSINENHIHRNSNLRVTLSDDDIKLIDSLDGSIGTPW